MSTIHEINECFKAGKLTKEIIYTTWLTDAASSLYSYMIMLQTLGRKQEAQLLDDQRNAIFDVRDGLYREGHKYCNDNASAARILDKVVVALQTQHVMLRQFKPEEAPCLEHAADPLITLAYYLRNGL